MEKKSTIFCDIDGTIFKYRKFETYKSSQPELLPKVKEQITKWRKDGHMVILTTARPEDLYVHTLKELSNNGIEFDKLIMGIERGPRYVINDMDPAKPGERAIGINLNRDKGFEEINFKEYNL
jgi:uncharacterized HAD superfamily protein